MLLTFGSNWSDRWTGVPAETVKAEWRRVLSDFGPEAVRLAWESVLKAGPAFPPNLAEFTALTRQFVRRGAHRLVAIADNRREGPPGGFDTLRSILNRAK